MAEVLIVGGGIGGLATALALSEAGHDVKVVEIQPDLQSSVLGVGIIQPDNALHCYALDTGGEVLNEFSEEGVQSAFTQIAASVRTAYTIDYISHQPSISGKYHTIEVRVEGVPDLIVDAKQGYWPTAAPNE